jgi:homoserine dehydrogenase
VSQVVRIGLLGKGTVGGAFAELVSSRAAAIEAATGHRPEISGVLRRGEGSFEDILEGSDLIVEVMGGVEPTRDLVVRSLEAGRPVVSANKQLISRHGDELFAAARRGGVAFRFEAAVAGVIPVIRVIQDSLAGAQIDKVFGIVNGTTNFILTEMAETGSTYEAALAKAQELGYAEADPREDVNGADAAAKMAILARLAFGARIGLDQVPHEGIEHVTSDDLAYAKEFGLSLKLLGVAERVGDGISVRVFPCFLYRGHPLSPIEGPFNAVMVESPAITEITMSGPGAGGIQTASAVLGDVVSIISGKSPPLSEEARDLEVVEDVRSAFYLHLEVADRPGVLAQVAEVLGRNDVSVRSVVQKGLGENARLLMVMHEGGERNFKRALDQIAGLDFLRSSPRAIRVIEEEFV